MKVGEKLGIKGKVVIRSYRAGMVEAVTPYLEELSNLKKLLWPDASETFKQHVRERIARNKQGIQTLKQTYFIRTEVVCQNLVVDSPNYGLDLVIQRLVGTNTYSLNILWIEIGTGSTAPASTDTALTTPSVRAAVSYTEDYGTTDAIVQAYITDANLSNATYQEVGSFIDGTSAIGSGQMFNHALLSPTYTKVAGQDTTIEIDFTLANS